QSGDGPVCFQHSGFLFLRSARQAGPLCQSHRLRNSLSGVWILHGENSQTPDCACEGDGLMIKSALGKGLLIAALQLVLIASLAAKYAYDRTTRPRVWVKTTNYDPDLPIRGRYMSLQLNIETPGLFEDKPLVEEKPPVLPVIKPSPCTTQND